MFTRIAAVVAPLALVVVLGCGSASDPHSYRLAAGGEGWQVVGGDRVADDVVPRYPEFFAVILDPSLTRLPDVRSLRDDLERMPVDRGNYDALNALAIAYFESNLQAEADRGAGLDYLARSFRSAKLLAVPWRAYSFTSDPALRDAILDFFEDVGSGEKRGTAATAPRVIDIVASLEKKEDDPARRARIREIATEIAVRVESGAEASRESRSGP